MTRKNLRPIVREGQDYCAECKCNIKLMEDTRAEACKHNYLGLIGKIWEQLAIYHEVPKHLWHNSQSLREVDHDKPLHRGGKDEVENCRVLCPRCHRIKSATESKQRSRLPNLKKKYKAKEPK